MTQISDSAFKVQLKTPDLYWRNEREKWDENDEISKSVQLSDWDI